MAIELTIIVPTQDNDGKSLQGLIRKFQNYLLDTVGGYTRENVSGAWKDANGKVYRDTSYRYVLTGDGIAEVQAVLPVWAGKLRQEVLYCSTREVSVNFIAPAIAAA